MKHENPTTSESIEFLTILRNTFVLFLIASISVTACGDSSTGVEDGNMDDNDEIGMEPVFSNVQMIFNQNCSNCHIGETTSGVRLDSYSNVMESVGNQYGINVIQPNDASASPLIDKIEPDPQTGSRMPPGGPFLSEERISQIREWINEGADNN